MGDDDALRLVRVGESDSVLRRVLAAQQLPAAQLRFVRVAAESLPLGDADPDRHSVAIVVGDQPVGMFALDFGGYLRELDDDPRAVLLRAFYVAGEYQGRGYARGALRALPEFLRQELPGVHRVVLSVNHENTAAIRVYLAAGFVDTGRDYLGGAAGPQHVFTLSLQSSAAGVAALDPVSE